MSDVNDLLNSEAIIEELWNRKHGLEVLICLIESRIAKFPEGSIRIVKGRKGWQYYLRTEKSDTEGKYIHAKDKGLAVALAQKDYDVKLLNVLEHQLKAIDRFLKDFDSSKLQQVYEDLINPRKQLVTPVFLSDEEYVDKWLNVPYEKLGFGKDDPEFYTAKGERVRSKSEVMISDALIRNNIPYRYEYPVYEDGVLIAAPDFNCLNVRLRKEYYWEHLGMMSNEKYVDRNVKKLEKYTYSKDFDERRLILTMETDKHPLNTRIIEAKIRKFLL